MEIITTFFDVWVMLGAGVAGYLMRKHDYEPAPLILGLVLGTVMERSFRQTLIMSTGEMRGLWESPICAVILIVAVVTAIAPGLWGYFRGRLGVPPGRPRT